MTGIMLVLAAALAAPSAAVPDCARVRDDARVCGSLFEAGDCGADASQRARLVCRDRVPYYRFLLAAIGPRPDDALARRECGRWLAALGVSFNGGPDRACGLLLEAYRAPYAPGLCWRLSGDDLRPAGVDAEAFRHQCMRVAYPVFGCAEAPAQELAECLERNRTFRALKDRRAEKCAGSGLCEALVSARPSCSALERAELGASCAPAR